MLVLDVKRTRQDFIKRKGQEVQKSASSRIEELENDMRIIKEFAKSIRKESS